MCRTKAIAEMKRFEQEVENSTIQFFDSDVKQRSLKSLIAQINALKQQQTSQSSP